MIEKLRKRIEWDEDCVIMGDINAAVNPDCKIVTPTAKLMLKGLQLTCTEEEPGRLVQWWGHHLGVLTKAGARGFAKQVKLDRPNGFN